MLRLVYAIAGRTETALAAAIVIAAAFSRLHRPTS